MTPGATPEEAALSFVAAHSRIFGFGDLELVEQWRSQAKRSAFKVFAYRQMIRGKEVDGGFLRVAVRTGDVPRVFYAAGKFAGQPAIGSEVPIVTAELAELLVEGQPGFGTLKTVGEPALVALRGRGERGDAWAWRVRTRTIDSPTGDYRRFYVDTALPRIIHRRDGVVHGDITTGTVKAPGVPLGGPGQDWLPFIPGSTILTNHPIPFLRVTGTVGSQQASSFTNRNGEFVLALGTVLDPIALEASVGPGEGEWYIVFDPSNHPLYVHSTESGLVGDHVELELTEPSSLDEQFRVAQVDVNVSAQRFRDFFTTYVSSTLPGLSRPFYFQPNDNNWECQAAAQLEAPHSWGIASSPGCYDTSCGPQCHNFGTHSWVGHEAGHVALHMVNEDLLEEMFVHEGGADTVGNMMNDDNVQGRSQYLDGSSARENPASCEINCQYPIDPNAPPPCDCGHHSAGQLLAGVWVRIREKFKDEFGNQQGLELARHAFGEWLLVTAGGEEPCNSAHEGTLIEVLSVVDGATEQGLVCQSFNLHNISCQSCCP